MSRRLFTIAIAALGVAIAAVHAQKATAERAESAEKNMHFSANSASSAVAFSQQPPTAQPQPLPMLAMGPNRDAGEAVTPAFEGWYYRPDGSVALLVGYFNRNMKQVHDIPVGPNNRIEPGGPDYGQPTHFLARRQWGVFTIPLPKDFGDKKLTWTIVANGHTSVIPLSMHPQYQVEPFEEKGMGNTPPTLKFEAGGQTFTGPPSGIATTWTATVNQPLTLTVWVTDKGPKVVNPPTRTPPASNPQNAAARGRGGRPDLVLSWALHRGPADVTFANTRPAIDKAAEGKTTTTATFSAPGDYILRAQANDTSGEGGGGFQCCWTNAHVKVTVK